MKYFPGLFSSLSLLLVTTVMPPCFVFADCKEFRIVETADKVEAVCVGEPPTPAELKARAEEAKRQELENNRQKAAAEKRQKDADVATAKSKGQEEAARKKEEASRKKQEVKPAPPKQPDDKSGTTGPTPSRMVSP